jgi:hypothetical protein
MKQTLYLLFFSFVFLSACTRELTSLAPPTESVKIQFTTIKDAVSKSISFVCDYTDPDNSQQELIYIKGQVIGLRPGANSPQKDVAGLIRENKVYFWNTADKTPGLVIDLTKITDDSDVTIAGSKVRSVEDAYNALEPYKQNCRITDDKDVFLLPTGVVFKE